jgi:hypothetical protein
MNVTDPVRRLSVASTARYGSADHVASNWKGETVRWQPVSPTLMACLVQHGQDRHARPDGQLLRYAKRAADHQPPL